MEIHPATDVDLVRVLDRLGELSAIELAASHIRKTDALASARWMMNNGESVAVRVGSDPVCVFGAHPENGQWMTWFLATDAWFAGGATSVRLAKRFLRGFAMRHGQLQTITCGTHPKIDRWFKVLGFRKVSEGNGMRVFVYG